MNLNIILPMVAITALAVPIVGQSAGRAGSWQRSVPAVPYDVAKAPTEPILQLVRQDYEKLQINRSVIGTPLVLGSRTFEHGLGTHSVSHIRVYSPTPITRFTSWVGLNRIPLTADGTKGSVDFGVSVFGGELYHSKVLRGSDEPVFVDLPIGGANMIDLHVGDGGDGPAWDHADWADAEITLEGGKTVRLDEMVQGVIPIVQARYPFSFLYGDKSSDELLPTWSQDQSTERLDDGKSRTTTTWTDPVTGLKAYWIVTRFSDYPAIDWVLYFENTGRSDTPIIQDVQALNVTLDKPLSPGNPYILHKTNGAPSNPTDFEVSTVVLNKEHGETMGAGGGRSSNKEFPFFKIETGQGSVIAAIGWSGQWTSRLFSTDDTHLNVTAGLEKTHFLLHPGEKVRSPRILLTSWEGDALEANAQFRQLIYRHYAARWNGKTPIPTLFCNTCFTRGGMWLNECDAENQISLIDAYAPLGLQALLTDAGWFTGGWPEGAGNWDARKDAYPDGMGPVAKAAKDHGMIYGLWFEPERVVSGTQIHRDHPDWVLWADKSGATGSSAGATGLLNFGLPEVQEYFYNIVKGYMELPGFRVYRQDFNMDPLIYWRRNDDPNRQGITEMKYVEGLYAYWDMIAKTWPDSLREECASGGRRIDLETVTRMHIHQDSDYWFQNDVDQGQVFGLSQYLPNNVFVGHVNAMDDYSFNSTLPTSLCMGWIADAKDFDVKRGKKLLDRYLAVRHLTIGSWYPLLPYSRDSKDWMASQWHRADLNEGMVLLFRHAESPYSTIQVQLHGLDPRATYELKWDTSGKKAHAKGSDLMNGCEFSIPEKRATELVTYKGTGK